MEMSENINELAAALSLVQSKIKDTSKDIQGHGYKYADLAQLLSAARPVLSEHRLCISQLCGKTERTSFDIKVKSKSGEWINGETFGCIVSVHTLLMHSSGQWIKSKFDMLAQYAPGMSISQSIGCAITYARRYSLAAIIGLAQTDDDASIVVNTKQENMLKTTEPTKEKGIENKSTVNKLMELIKSLNISSQAIDRWAQSRGVKHIHELTEAHALQLINHLEKSKKPIEVAINE